MRNLLLGFLLGIMVTTGVSAWAQLSNGSVYSYGDSGVSTFSDHKGTTGSLYTFPGSGVTTYQDSTGRMGSFYTYPGSGVTTYSFSGGKGPC